LVLPVLTIAQNQTEVTDPRGETKDATGKIVPLGYCFGILNQRARGPQVEDLQNILKSDPTIYPEGLVTGYYGPMTKKAIQKLQKKFGLPQTGIVDEQTARIILPCPIDVKLTVVSPNGGEVWDKKDTHEITWKLSKSGGTEPLTPTEIETEFFWPKGRIDLLKSDGSFARHIANVNLANQSYTWKINPAIPNGDDYKIRIGLGPVLGCEKEESEKEESEKEEKCPSLWNPKFTFGDESDNPFSITGEVTPPVEGFKIQEAIDILRSAISQLQKLLSLLESMR